MHFRPTPRSLSLSLSLAALSGHCHLCSLSRVRHATPHISARPFAPRFFLFLLPPPLSFGGTGATIRARNAETAWDKRDAILIGFYLFLPIRFFLKCVANFSRRKWSTNVGESERWKWFTRWKYLETKEEACRKKHWENYESERVANTRQKRPGK